VRLGEGGAIDDQACSLQSLGGATEDLNLGDQFVVHDDLLGMKTITSESTSLRYVADRSLAAKEAKGTVSNTEQIAETNRIKWRGRKAVH
jgi:hypothetical protein